MAATTETSISIQTALFEQVERLAQQMNISRNQLFELALETFIQNDLTQKSQDEISEQDSAKQLVINQGDIYWIELESASSESDIPHPYVIIQDNLLNHSRITTVVACALTSNVKRASLPGNLLLDAGEANLPKPSVVEVSKVSTIDKSHLGEYIGTLTEQRVSQIVAGMRFLQSSFFPR